MKKPPVGECKTDLPEPLKDVKADEDAGEAAGPKKATRLLGTLQGKATYKLNDGYKMTEDEFLDPADFKVISG